MEKEKKIDNRQFSFRKQRSTIDAIAKITTKIIDEFRRKEKSTAIFFDIKKSYDKVNRNKDTGTTKKYENTGKIVEIH